MLAEEAPAAFKELVADVMQLRLKEVSFKKVASQEGPSVRWLIEQLPKKPKGKGKGKNKGKNSNATGTAQAEDEAMADADDPSGRDRKKKR